MKEYKDKEWLEYQYRDLEKSVRKISNEFNWGKTTVMKWIQKHQIETRPNGTIKGKMKKGGVKLQNGYIMLFKPDHRMSNSNGYIKEQRFIMAQHLGRALEQDEIVHHIDGDRLNNYIGNLEIMTVSEHVKLHYKKRSDSFN